ncbi:MAG: HAMP domain-containing histidine kinase [Gammaproteobacteria bacterium]|nr:HAMP domain-containing histidine kinase [Gammaproteobacteria bacterium]
MATAVIEAEFTGDVVFAELVASAVHDVKNSLALVLNSAESLAEDAVVSPSAQRTLLVLQHEARRANADLMSLLGLFKLERGRPLVQPMVVECEDLLSELVAYNATLLAHRGIVLEAAECRVAEGYFDRGLVAGVLNAAINNTFSYARAHVTLACRLHEGYTVFSVLDDGGGYASRMLTSVADATESYQHNHRSTGLGLFFARRVAEMHVHRGRSGRIVLSNQPGGCFELWLP